MSALSHSSGLAPNVAVVGGGITGLAAALHLHEMAPQVEIHLLEATARLGGTLQTSYQDGFLMEHAADNFLADPQAPWALDLIRRYGLQDQLLETHPQYRRALVVKRGRLYPLPEGFRLMLPGTWRSIVTSPLLSWPGRLRVLGEWLVGPLAEEREETLKEFAIRRLGREAYEWLVEPLVAGIYTSDPERLSVDAALPRFRQLETQYRSLTRAALAMRRQAPSGPQHIDTGARYAQFLGPREGMARLIDRLAGRLGPVHVHLGTRVEQLTFNQAGWRLRSSGSVTATPFAAVLLAVPAYVSAQLLRPLDPGLAEQLDSIEYASSAVVCLGYARHQIRHALDAFGLVLPAREGRQILAVSFASVKFPGRAPEGHVLLRGFLGGAGRADVVDQSDAALVAMAHRESAQLLGIDGQPLTTRVIRWCRAMPQYHLGHCRRIGHIRDQLQRWPGLALAGNYFEGVGIPHCIHSGQQATVATAAILGNSHPKPHQPEVRYQP